MNILEINQDNRHLSLYRGFIRIHEKEKILSEIPLDIILAVIVTGHQITYTNNILMEFAYRNIPLVICGENFHPIGILLTIEGNYKQTEIMSFQISPSQPLLKNLWKVIVKLKIKNQAEVLEKSGIKNNELIAFYKNVKSGDKLNYEAIAARIYFNKLFGDGFIRNPSLKGINSFLNYGYAIIRAALARYVVAAGLIPSLGIHHRNKLNTFCLVDDLIEPYRPFVDLEVFEIFKNETDKNNKDLLPNDKMKLVALLEKNIKMDKENLTLNMAMQKTVWSFVDSLKNKDILLKYGTII